MDSTYSHNVFGLCSYRWAIFAAVLCLTLALTEPAHAKLFTVEPEMSRASLPRSIKPMRMGTKTQFG